MNDVSVGNLQSVAIGRGLALVLALSVALIPLWSADVPPMLDYHNHLARQFILAGLPKSEYLQKFYEATWHVIPYLAMDGIVQGLARFMPVATAGKVFLSLLLLLLATAPLALSLALFHRVSPIALLGLLMVHNMTLSYGFVNYLFGVGFAVCLLSLWIGLREDRRGYRLVVFPFLATLLFLSHLLGFMIYGLSAAAYELGRHVAGVRSRIPRAPLRLDRTQKLNLILLGLQLVVPLIIYFAFGTEKPAGGYGQNTYGGIERKFELLFGMFDYLIPPYSWTLDRIVTIAVPIGVLGMLAFRRLEFSKPMLWPIGAMLLFFFAMPMELIGGWGADHRLLVPIGLMLAGSINTPSTPLKGLTVAVWAIVVLVVVRVAAVTVEWRRANEGYAEYFRAFDSLTDGSRVFFAFEHEAGQKVGRAPVYHPPLLAVTKKHVYLPFLSVGANVTMVYRPEVEPLQRLSPGPVLTRGQSPNWSAIVDQYDYFLLVDQKYFASPVPKELIPVFKGDRVNVYRGPRKGT